MSKQLKADDVELQVYTNPIESGEGAHSVIRTTINAGMSLNFNQIGLLIVELAAFERRDLQWKKRCDHSSAFIFERIFILARNKDNHKSLDVFEFLQESTTDYRERMDSRRHFSAKVAKNCTVIEETGVILHSPDATQKSSQLISLKAINRKGYSTTFSVKIVSTGRNASIGIGVVPEDYEPEAFPGWYDKSVGYHADDGGIFIGSGFPSTRTLKARDGDIMSIRLLYARKRCLVQFCVNKQRIGDLVYLKHLKGTDLYPCLSMDSKGAAVQILEDEFWYSDKDGTDITPMTTEQKEDIWISPAKEIILTERILRDSKMVVCTGLMSIANPTEKDLLFKLQYREDEEKCQYYLLGKYNQHDVWAQRLEIARAYVGDAIKVEWVSVTGKDSAKKKAKISPKKLFNANRARQNNTYTLNVKIEKIENTDNQDDHDKQRQSSSTAAKDDDPTDLLKYLVEMERQRQTKQNLPFDEDDDVSYDDDVSSSSSDDDVHRIKGGTGAPRTYTDQGLVDMVYNCKDENTIIKNTKQMLKIEKGIKVDGGYDKDGYTCLHLAASRGHINLVEILLEKGANPAKKSRNFRKDTPFEVAMRKGKDETAELLVKIMSIKSVLKLFWAEEAKNIELSIKLLLDSGLMKTTVAVLDKFKDPYGTYCMAPLELDDRNMCPCAETYSVTDMTAYQMIARKNLKDFACHGCVKALTEYKWRKYGRKLFWITALIYFISWISLSIGAVMGVMANDVAKYDKTVDYVRGVFEITTCAFALLTLAAESLQIYRQKTEYFKDVFNYMEFMSSALILCVPPLRFTYFYEQWYVFAVGYIMCTFRIFKFVSLNRSLGHLGLIIVQLVVYDVGKFVIFFTIILLSFSGGLLLSLKGDDDLAVHNETSTYWGIIFVGIRVLIEGQPFLDYTGPSGYRTFSTIIMLLFLAFTCVVMINILLLNLAIASM